MALDCVCETSFAIQNHTLTKAATIAGAADRRLSCSDAFAVVGCWLTCKTQGFSLNSTRKHLTKLQFDRTDAPDEACSVLRRARVVKARIDTCR